VFDINYYREIRITYASVYRTIKEYKNLYYDDIVKKYIELYQFKGYNSKKYQKDIREQIDKAIIYLIKTNAIKLTLD
jgi:hypothetical protein